MIVDFGKELVDMEGKAIPNAKGEPAVLRGVAVDALLAVFNDEDRLSGEEKLKRFILAEKIHNGCDDVTVEEVGLVKKLIGKAFSVIIVGQAWQMLEGK